MIGRMSEIPDQADRYFLYIIGVDVDLDAQLEAIRALLWRHRPADADLTKEIKGWEDHARSAKGTGGEHAIDEWMNSVHTSIYQEAAHSLAAVGMLAPLLESMLVQSFAGLRTEFASILPPLCSLSMLRTFTRCLSRLTVQALRARTAGRSAGVGRRRALAGNVTTATVLPVMSKNSTD
jgi:hypothetical protein